MTMEQAFPQGWIEQLQPLLGAELPDFLDSYVQPPVRGIRLRPGVMPPPDAEEEIPWAEGGYYLPLDSTDGASPLHEAGAWYIQEPSAMIPAAVLRPQPGERVLDLCAAPGGKSTQLAAYMRGRGVLVCNEPVPNRAQVLSRNLERMGVANGVAVCALPEELSPRWPGYFDKILVDAPCSGEGMFRRHPETRLEWNAASPQGCAQRQSQILDHAAHMLRPGGKMVYSTCTFNPTENEGVIQGFLFDHPEFSLLPFDLPGIGHSDGMLHIWPHRVRGEGHFTALLQKSQDAPERALREKKKREAPWPAPSKGDAALAEAFLADHIRDAVIPNALFAGKIVQLPDALPPLAGVKVLRLGLQLGEIRGRVFVPDHALALSCQGLRAHPVTLAEARAYQAGQTLAAKAQEKGFLLPVYQGMNLGWAKAAEGQLKNHYPKGLRRMG